MRAWHPFMLSFSERVVRGRPRLAEPVAFCFCGTNSFPCPLLVPSTWPTSCILGQRHTCCQSCFINFQYKDGAVYYTGWDRLKKTFLLLKAVQMWMDGRMDGWVDGKKDRQKDRQTDRQTDWLIDWLRRKDWFQKPYFGCKRIKDVSLKFIKESFISR